MQTSNVLEAGIALSQALKELGADVYLGVLPDIPGRAKTGADDFLVEFGAFPLRKWVDALKPFSHPELYKLDVLLYEISPDTPREQIPFELKPLLLKLTQLEKGIGEQYLATRVKDYFNLTSKDLENLGKILADQRRQQSKQHNSRDDTHSPYFVDSDGFLCRYKQTREGLIAVPIANFNARISEEQVEDNGVDITHIYVLDGETKEKNFPKIEVAATSFSSMNWPNNWGTEAILEPGSGTKDYVRHAIQTRSRPKKILTYTHTGWREINGQWVYLTCGGAIGGEDITVKLPTELTRYSLPLVPEHESEAIKASLSFLDIGDRLITFPLFGLLYLTPMTTILSPSPNFSEFLHGDTGVFKTTLGLLQLSHFGNFASVTNLSNLEDTANALGKRAFTLKDSLMVMDDLHPSTRKYDAQQSESIAQRLIRSFSNRTGRARLNADTSEKGRYEPRGMLLITGEEIVSMQSTLARVVVIEVAEGDVDVEALTKLQEKSHLLPHAMASYILWLRANIEDIRAEFPKGFARLRQKATKENNGLHPKLSEQVAFLQFAMDTALSWLVDQGVVEEERAREMTQEGWNVFVELAKKQSQRLSREDPVRILGEILHSLITQAKVRIEPKEKGHLNDYLGGFEGDLIGYYDDHHFYFLPTALWHAVQRYRIAEGTQFPVSKNTLQKTLRDRKLLILSKNGECSVLVRIKGKVIRVLKILRNILDEEKAGEDTAEGEVGF